MEEGCRENQCLEFGSHAGQVSVTDGQFSSVVLLNVPGRRLTFQGQAETNVEAWFSIALRPRKP